MWLFVLVISTALLGCQKMCKTKNVNWVQTMHLLVFFLCCLVLSSAQYNDMGGHIKNGTVTLDKIERPYQVNSDILITENGVLTIRPGVKLEFAPGTGIIVQFTGSLRIEGTADQPVVLTTKQEPETFANDPPVWPNVRLVDGDSPLLGRVQVKYKEHWWSVCTASRNWTERDFGVVCRQLGFEGGRFFRWFDRHNNTRQLSLPAPECDGLEPGIERCPGWNAGQRRTGSGICDYHQDMGIYCEPYLQRGPTDTNWKGLQFKHVASQEVAIMNKRVTRRQSMSWLNHVRIRHAGRDLDGKAVAAIDVEGHPPQMRGVEVTRSAYTGLNITQLEETFDVEDSIFQQNRGCGIYVNSTRGQIGLQHTKVIQNGAEGVHYVRHPVPISSTLIFCSSPSGQRWPQKYVQESNDVAHGCGRSFLSRPNFRSSHNEVITIFFSNFERVLLPIPQDWRRDDSKGSIDVYDSDQIEPSRFIGSFRIDNNTKVQSFSSERGSLYVDFKAAEYTRLRFAAEAFLGTEKSVELRAVNCSIRANNGRGIWIRDMMSGIHVNTSRISENTYMAGIHVDNGAGDVLINQTGVTDNAGAGINVTYAGGYRHIDRCTIASNTEHGVLFQTNITSIYQAVNQSVHVTRSNIYLNRFEGVLLRNSCRSDIFWNISMNNMERNGLSAVRIESCLSLDPQYKQKLLICHNKFSVGNKPSVFMKPVLNLVAYIEHNEFREHKAGAMVISNRAFDPIYENRSAKIYVRENWFLRNRGAFVAKLGMIQDSPVQSMLFMNNRLRENVVSEPFAGLLKPRSRTAAVVVVSSNNTIVYRNEFDNRLSAYELASHLENSARVINATHNYWSYTNPHNTTEGVEVYNRIFDRKNRYNLARVEFLQYIFEPNDLNTENALSIIRDRLKLMRFMQGDNIIGGEVDGEMYLGPGDYTVKQDIYVQPRGRLIIKPPATLSFEQSIGIMIQGFIDAQGHPNEKIRFKNAQTPIRSEDVPSVDNALDDNFGPLALSKGTYGRVQITVKGRTGGICNYGFSKEDAALICHQLGYVMSDYDWQLEASEMEESDRLPVVISNLDCLDEDTSITNCQYQIVDEDFEDSCPVDVGIRCHLPSWSGLRLGLAAERSFLNNIIVESAGQHDYATHKFKPAIQIDMNHHHIDNVDIQNNRDSGIGFIWNNIFVEKQNPVLKNSRIMGNQKHGIEIRSQGLDIIENRIEQNYGSGIFYDPSLTHEEHHSMRQWVDRNVEYIPDRDDYEITLAQFVPKFLVINQKPNVRRRFYIRSAEHLSVGLLVISPFRLDSTEEMIIYKGKEARKEDAQWSLKNNLTSFPIREAGFIVTVLYNSGSMPKGGAVLYLHASDVIKRAPKILCRDPACREKETRHYDFMATTNILNNAITNNKYGFWSSHYNRDIGQKGEYFNRNANETFFFKDNQFAAMQSEAVYVSTPYWDPERHQLAEINYTMIGNNISHNTAGISQYSRDIRSSNNLFHWTINLTEFSGNTGGIDLRLPYVLQYNENFTHTMCIHENVFERNTNFQVRLDGHFSDTNMTHNRFQSNAHASRGVISIRGMEKRMKITDNEFLENDAKWMVEIDIDSHSEIFSTVSAQFARNQLRNNVYSPHESKQYIIRPTDISVQHQPQSYAMAVRGVQQINVTRNLFINPHLQYELLTAMPTSSLNAPLNVRENYWGTTRVDDIQERIFDFDDWNSYAIADFSPFLGSANVYDPQTYPAILEDMFLDLDRPLGGRVYRNVTLHDRHYPYVVKRDLTILPGVTLTIMDGAVLEFHPGVGILVLGDLIALGRPWNPVVFQPVQSSIINVEGNSRLSYLPPAIPDDMKIRLCIDIACESVRNDGFLEMYNKTTMQWVPICDPRFTERNAQIVCTELGYKPLNVELYRGPRWEMGINEISRIRTWPHPLECTGLENKIKECEYRLNGYGTKDYQCVPNSDNYVYVFCGRENRKPTEEYWGGIRFSVENHKPLSERYYGRHIQNYLGPTSSLRYTIIRGAGILHNERAPAIQMVHRRVVVELSNITQNAHNAIDIIASPGYQYIHAANITYNLGAGINFLTLNGQTNEKESNYMPLGDIDIPYNVFGMLDICDQNKSYLLRGRVLLYYKYDNRPVDCVKIFTAEVENIGFRIIQFNLFNATNYSPVVDHIKLFDGDIFNKTAPLLGHIEVGQHPDGHASQRIFYKTTMRSLSVQLHATGGSERNGFIAEVLTLPPSALAERDIKHNISGCFIFNNNKGGVTYRSAGELTPAVGLRRNRIEENGKQRFGNFSSIPGAVFMDIQNAMNVDLQDNLFVRNQGGLYIKVNSENSVSALRGLVKNNVFSENVNRETLGVVGGRSGNLQHMHVVKNYFARNWAEYRDNLLFDQVGVNLTENILVGNRGKHQIAIYGFKKQLSNGQVCYRNWIWDNEATYPDEKSTILAGSPGQIYIQNYLYNRKNYFELIAANRTPLDNENLTVDAAYNWWSFNSYSGVSGRIKDKTDLPELMPVKFDPFLTDNSTLITGNCAGGWQMIGGTCYLLVPAAMTYGEAKQFCQRDSASLPYLKRQYQYDLERYVEERNDDYDIRFDRIWVQSIDVGIDDCPVLYKHTIDVYDCNARLPFVCERAQEIYISLTRWYQEPVSLGSLGALIALIFFVGLMSAFWCCKSRQRHKEHLERRNSIRASIRSNRSISGSYGDLGYKHQIERALRTYGGSTPVLKMQSSMDSIEKKSTYTNPDGDNSSYEGRHADYSSELDDKFAADPKLENSNIDAMVRPTFDLTYENPAYHDQSRDSRDWTPDSTIDLDRKIIPNGRTMNGRDNTFTGSPHYENTTVLGIRKPPPTTNNPVAPIPQKRNGHNTRSLLSDPTITRSRDNLAEDDNMKPRRYETFKPAHTDDASTSPMSSRKDDSGVLLDSTPSEAGSDYPTLKLSTLPHTDTSGYATPIIKPSAPYSIETNGHKKLPNGSANRPKTLIPDSATKKGSKPQLDDRQPLETAM